MSGEKMTIKRTLSIILVASLMMLAAGFMPRVADNVHALPLAQTNVTVPYSGSLTDPAGQAAVDGIYTFSFKLYDFEKDGEPLWTEAQANVTVLGGSFSVLLGSANPLSKAIVDSGGRWLEVGVRGPDEKAFTILSPRQELSSSAPTGLAAPQALSCAHNHLYESWAGSDSFYTFRVENTALSTGDAIRGVSYATSSNDAAVKGANQGSGGIGVLGTSIYGTGVAGRTTVDSGTTTTGVWGQVAAIGSGVKLCARGGRLGDQYNRRQLWHVGAGGIGLWNRHVRPSSFQLMLFQPFWHMQRRERQERLWEWDQWGHQFWHCAVWLCRWKRQRAGDLEHGKRQPDRSLARGRPFRY